MQNLVVAGAALAFALVSAAPLSAADNPEKSAKSGTAFTSPFSPEAIAASLAAVQGDDQSTESRLVALDERIEKARGRISRGKKVFFIGFLAGVAAGSAFTLSTGEACYDRDECTAEQLNKRKMGYWSAIAGGSVAGYGLRSWLGGKVDLRRAESERRSIISLSASGEQASLSYNLRW